MINKTIGRSTSSNIHIDHPTVSGSHAVVNLTDGKIILTDSNSTNGTFVNGTIIKSTEIKEGDEIKFGDYVSSFQEVAGSLTPEEKTVALRKWKIGRRDTNDIVIQNNTASGEHAVLTELGGGTYELNDLNSSNGTFVNGNKISAVKVSTADKITFGSFETNIATLLDLTVVEAPQQRVISEPNANTQTQAPPVQETPAPQPQPTPVPQEPEKEYIIVENESNNAGVLISPLVYIGLIAMAVSVFLPFVTISVEYFSLSFSLIDIASNDMVAEGAELAGYSKEIFYVVYAIPAVAGIALVNALSGNGKATGIFGGIALWLCLATLGFVGYLLFGEMDAPVGEVFEYITLGFYAMAGGMVLYAVGKSSSEF